MEVITDMTEQIGTATTSNGVATITYKPTTSGSKSITAVNTATDTINSNTSNTLALTVTTPTWTTYNWSNSPSRNASIKIYSVPVTSNMSISGTFTKSGNEFFIGFTNNATSGAVQPLQLRLQGENIEYCSETNRTLTTLKAYESGVPYPVGSTNITFNIVNNVLSVTVGNITKSNVFTIPTGSSYYFFYGGWNGNTVTGSNITVNGGGG